MSEPLTKREADTRTDGDRASPEIVRVLVANHDGFLRFLERRVGSAAAAEEILQDALAKSVEKVGGIRDEESAVAWFYRLLRNAVIDHHRRSAAAARALTAWASELATREGDDPALHAEVCQCVTALVDTLKPEYASVIRHSDLGDGAIRDYAEREGLTVNNATVRLHRARQALGKQLARTCGACATHGCLDCSCAKGGAGGV